MGDIIPACCPLCDNAIMDYDHAGIYTAHDAKCLAHMSCLEELKEQETDGEED